MKRERASSKRSPLKDDPLRLPGESLQEEIDEALSGSLLPSLAVTLMLIVLTILEWWRYWNPSPAIPIPLTLVTILAILWFARSFFKTRDRVRRLVLGAKGERSVAQMLDALAVHGFRTFHDLPGNRFNIDHAVVGPQGVFIVETKTLSKLERGNPKVTVESGRILVSGRQLDRDPLVQARVARDWLRDFLQHETGRRFPVRAVVTFPGWWVEQPSRRTDDVWVLNPKMIPAFVAEGRASLAGEDVALVAARLADLSRRDRPARPRNR